MRLRNVPGARDRIAADTYAFQDDEAVLYKGKWNTDVFKNSQPVHIEIGMGKGMFIMELAGQNPNINYIGIEKYSSVLLRALEKQEAERLPNIRFIRMDAENICDVFNAGEIARIYLNFSDPWPKDRHAKRRLTSGQFLARYDKILIPDGKVIFKTDNRTLFDFSLEEIQTAGWILEMHTFDLHNSEYLADNVMTEYESKFVALGNPICKLVCYRTAAKQ